MTRAGAPAYGTPPDGTPPDGTPVGFAGGVVAQALARPEQALLADCEGSITGAELAALIFRLARVLAHHGVHTRSRVAIAGPNRIATLAVRYAAGLLGASTTLCPDNGSVDDLAGYVRGAGADVLVVFPESATVSVDAARAVPLALSYGPVDNALADIAAAASGEPTTPVPDRAARDSTAVLVPSGGTTGAPKISARTFERWSATLAGPPDAARRQLVCTPLAYIGQVAADRALLGGGTVVLRDRFDADAVRSTIAEHDCTHVTLVEPQLVELVDHPDFHAGALPSLVAITHVGAPAPASLRRRLLNRAGPVLAHPYGASEIGIASLLAGPDYTTDHPELMSTAGRVVDGVEVRIVGPDGVAVEPMACGLIAVESAQVANDYVGRTVDSPFHGGRFVSGDVGFVDGLGYLHVRGRRADAIRVGARTIFPVDVENALCAHPAVRYATAVPSGTGYAVAVLPQDGGHLDGATMGRLVDGVCGKGRARVHVVEQIPLTAQGKPDRRRVRDLVG